MSYLSTGEGRRVYYEDHGGGDGALLLLHGWGMSARAWDPVLAALCAAGRRVVLLDHRGCGRSDKDFADMSIAAIASDTAALVRTLGLRRVVLNGWSLGGAVAVEAARELGETCTGLVLTCGATPTYVRKADFPHGGTEADLAGTLTALATDRVDVLRGLSRAVCAKEVGDDVERWLWHIFLQSSPLAARTLGELAALDQREQLAGLAVPVLSIVGSADAVVAPPIGRWVGEHHPNARVVEMEGVGHAPFIEDRERYVDELLRFLAERDPAWLRETR